VADRELALLLDSGIVIYDSTWRCVADVMFAFHGFAVRHIYGVIVDAETLVQVYPPPDPETPGRTSVVLG
jgi:hypothetical protein